MIVKFVVDAEKNPEFAQFLKEFVENYDREMACQRIYDLMEAGKLPAGTDIHQLAAAALYDIAYEDVTPQQRKAAKVRGFARMYGSKPATVAGVLIRKGAFK